MFTEIFKRVVHDLVVSFYQAKEQHVEKHNTYSSGSE